MWLLPNLLICVTFYEIKLLQHHTEMFACDLGHLSASQVTLECRVLYAC